MINSKCGVLNNLVQIRNCFCQTYHRLLFYSTSPKYKTDDLVGVVGLEIHAQINSVSKLFSGAGTDFASPVNHNVSLFDASIPGTLPVLNRRCVEAGVLTALALKSTLSPVSMFDRKHYFYADMPQGYQITQQRMPLARGGQLQFQVVIPGNKKPSYTRTARLHQLQLEQDSGKSLHDPVLSRSLIDLNRAGVPLMELVFEPDLVNGDEAAALVKELTLVLTKLNTCLCKMEEGGMRVDANISVHKPGAPLGVRTEVKNIGSVRAVARAVNYEIQRQQDVLRKGGSVVNETRSWDAERSCTVPMRDKEEKQDYRFMPEPNLPPLRLDMDGTCRHPHMVSVPELLAALPELPEQTRLRLQADYPLSPDITMRLVNEPELQEMFECVVRDNPSCSHVIAANLLTIELMTLVNKDLCSLGSGRPSTKDIGVLTELFQDKKINLQTVRTVLEILAGDSTQSATEIITNQEMWLVSDPGEITRICEEAIQRNPKLVEAYKKGKTKIFSALLGDIAKVTKNRADMSLVTKQLQELLKKE
ncbi:glutamyl-tRNA(Gln) amidotransferase subunit B, mitochondrial [Macrosteles quadrilineatus]|uniref:glutamyl-tRNA(Gln) amidotransferase subunit B, mitochondrial n=1 Tax=Macrosteles quadrilineatus TaxID=74068 RepID=UPI0023E225A2|nr:glutamyl-tRNA(Gln) amidotransferase subunit B, mitochondrial [Macrosteles quadrilineatus]XP_054275281.1 glutamyl-tRNA(Gln) amidotransferase subunit B, mitochondrial [Macrosteles quadrilineatus]